MNPTQRTPSLLPVLLPLGLAALAGLVHAPALHNGFAGLDDSLYVSANRHVLAGLTWEGLRWAFSLAPNTYWHPATWLSLMLDSTLFGTSAWGYHFTNLALHAANTLLVFLFLQAASGRTWASAAAAALFAVHPIHVESVAWITARKDVLSAFFFLAAALAYVRWTKQGRRGLYLLSVACFILAVLAKPTTTTLPFALLLFDVWPLRRLDLRDAPQLLARLNEKIPYFAVVALALAMVSRSHPLVGTGGDFNVPLLLRLENVPVAYVTYLRKLFWPGDQAVFYSFPLAIPAWRWLSALGALGGLSLAAAAMARRSPALTLGWTYYLGTMFPMLGLVQVGLWPALAERYAYLPFVGLYMAVCFGLGDLFPARFRAPVLATALAAALAAMIPATHAQVALWGNTEALFRQATANVPDNWTAYTLLGQELAAQGRLDDAEQALRTSLRLYPDNGAAYSALGATLENQGKPLEALAVHREAIRRNPNHHMGYANLGWALLRNLEYGEETLQAFAKAEQLVPEIADFHLGKAQLHHHRGEFDEAAQEFRTALELQPGIPGAHLGLGQVLMETRDYAGALDEFTQEMPNSPDNLELLTGLGFALAHLGRYTEALPRLMAVAKLRPDAAASWYNLGVVQARAGEPDRARQSLERALVLAPDFNRARDALDNLPRKFEDSSPTRP